MLSHTDVYPYISTLQLTGTHWNTTFQAKLGLLIFRSFILFIIDSKQSLVLSHIGTGYHMGITKGYFTSSQEMQLGVAQARIIGVHFQWSSHNRFHKVGHSMDLAWDSNSGFHFY